MAWLTLCVCGTETFRPQKVYQVFFKYGRCTDDVCCALICSFCRTVTNCIILVRIEWHVGKPMYVIHQ